MERVEKSPEKVAERVREGLATKMAIVCEFNYNSETAIVRVFVEDQGMQEIAAAAKPINKLQYKFFDEEGHRKAITQLEEIIHAMTPSSYREVEKLKDALYVLNENIRNYNENDMAPGYYDEIQARFDDAVKYCNKVFEESARIKE